MRQIIRDQQFVGRILEGTDWSVRFQRLRVEKDFADAEIMVDAQALIWIQAEERACEIEDKISLVAEESPNGV